MSTMATPASPRRGWSLVWRYGLAALIGLLMLFAGSPMATVIKTVPAAVLDVALGVGAAFAMRLRHRHPLALAVGLLAAGTVAITVTGFMLWGYVHLCTRRRWREITIALVALVASQVVAFIWSLPQLANAGITVETDSRQLTQADPGFLVAWGASSLGLTGVLTAWGLYIGARRDLLASLHERAETAEREQELQVLAGQAAERNRIAREMHDVLAHRMSLVSMHAGALAYRDDLTPEQTREVARTIQENAHQSLTELRSVLGSLRDDSGLLRSSGSAGDDSGSARDGSGSPAPVVPAKPQPTLADVPTLVADAKQAGDRITLRYEVDGDLPAQVGRHAYRIVQESLTNARKHAPHTKVLLTLTGDPEQGLTIVARNPLGRGVSTVPGAGVGLLGVSERAQMVGGWVKHGVDDEGWFTLTAWLPWSA